MPRSWTTDTLGPMARSARDVARLLGVVAGHDPRDPTTRALPVPDYEAGLEAPVAGLRIGVPREGWAQGVATEVADALDGVRASFEAAGCRAREVDVPDSGAAFELAEIIVKCEAASLHERWLRERPGDYSVAIRTPIEAGLCIPAAHYLHAQRLRGPTLEAFRRAVFTDTDALLMPVTPAPAPRLADCDPSSTAGAARTMAEFPRFTRPVSYLGLPALVAPCGFSQGGLPIAFQLVGPPFAEALLLRIAHHYQQASDWHRRRPPIG